MGIALINADGSPMSRARADFRSTAYEAADPMSQELSSWRPWLASADSDLLYERATITARIRHLVRNNGWASGMVSRELDNVIGAGMRLSCKPDWRALGLTAEWSADFADALEAQWRMWAEDPAFYCDSTRHGGFGAMLGLAYRHYLVDGDALGVLQWLPGRGGMLATALRIVDPDRLCNPDNRGDTDRLRAGVELDENSAAIAYHIRRRHPNDIDGGGSDFLAWERIPRETRWGRPIGIHYFDRDRDGLTRGVGRLTPVLERLKMLDRYDKVELQAAVLNAILAAFVESPFDHEMVEGMLGDTGAGLGAYQDARKAFHADRRITLGGVQIPTLFPGEKIGFHAAARPNSAFAPFEAACLRNIASGSGQSYEQISSDWSQTNYSSARGALLEVWRTLSRRRTSFAQGFATPVMIAVTEEVLDRGLIALPHGAPDFYQARTAYTRCKWIGPGRGWVDPVKEKQGAVMGMAAGMSTLEDECAEQGKDYQEVLVQLAREIAEMPKEVLHPAQIDFAKIVGSQSGGLMDEERRSK